MDIGMYGVIILLCIIAFEAIIIIMLKAGQIQP